MASYDPIFYPFHAGLDMHYSLFLAAHPHARFTKDNAVFELNSIFNYAAGSKATPTTPLTPFRIKSKLDPRREVPPKYVDTEQLYNEADWKYWYDSAGQNLDSAQAITQINKRYSWLNPTAASLNEKFVPEADRTFVKDSIKDMRKVQAFVPNPDGLPPWPPLIDDNKVVVQLHPPEPSAVPTATPGTAPATPVAPGTPPAHAPLAVLSHRVTRAAVSKSSSAKTSVSPTASSGISHPQLSNGIVITKKSEKVTSEPVNSKGEDSKEEGKRKTPSFVYDPPHPEQ